METIIRIFLLSYEILCTACHNRTLSRIFAVISISIFRDEPDLVIFFKYFLYNVRTLCNICERRQERPWKREARSQCLPYNAEHQAG